MKKWIVVMLVFVVMAVSAVSHYLGFFALSFSSLAGQQIQRIELTDMSGKAHSFDELQGKNTVIYFLPPGVSLVIRRWRLFSSCQRTTRLE